MIPVTNSMTETDNLPGTEYSFTIGDPRWVMKSLADLYSQKEKALTREYSTNAWDAHVEAGVKRPIEVTLPTMMHPFFEVQDFGVGMSREHMTETYTSFGASSKRESNDYNGVLGFGSKSAVAYTTQFTVTSVKDGHKTVGVISRKPDDSIVLKIVATSKTSEPNGTKVVIPVHTNTNAFAHIARDFYRFWPEGSVLVDGVAPERVQGTELDDNLLYTPNDDESYVVMGNVAYRIANPSALFREVSIHEVPFVAFVPNGAVEFTPSREDLKYTDLTKSTLHGVINNFAKNVKAKAAAEIAGAKTHAEAFNAWTAWRDVLGQGSLDNLTFKGVKLENVFQIPAVRYRPEAYGYSTTDIQQWRVDQMHMTVIITGYNLSINSGHKAKAREYAALNGLGASYFLFTTKDKIDNVWVDQSRVVDWETLKAAIPKKVRNSSSYRTPTRVRGTFDFATHSGHVYEKNIPANHNIYYMRAADYKNFDVASILAKLGWKDSVVVKLAINRVDKFVRDNPNAKEFLEAAKREVVLDGGSLVPDYIKPALNVDYDTTRWMQKLKNVMGILDDPAWNSLDGLVKQKDSALKEYEANMSLAHLLGMRYNGEVKQYTPQGATTDLLKPYPLLRAVNLHASTLRVTDIVVYMNAAYAQKKP